MLAALGLGLYARHWLALAGRSRVGARAEDEVRRALAALEAQGWTVRHSLPWRGRGDVDSIAIAPAGIAFAIETKTRTYELSHLVHVREQATWLARRRRRSCPCGALAVLCVVRARGVQRYEQDVLVVSIDRLIVALRAAADGIRSRAVVALLARARASASCVCEHPYGEQASEGVGERGGGLGGVLV